MRGGVDAWADTRVRVHTCMRSPSANPGCGVADVVSASVASPTAGTRDYLVLVAKPGFKGDGGHPCPAVTAGFERQDQDQVKGRRTRLGAWRDGSAVKGIYCSGRPGFSSRHPC